MLPGQGADSRAGRERKWIEAHLQAWFSVLEVKDTVPGKSITFRDLLTGRETRVTEKTASQSLVKNDAVLGRVVEMGGEALLSGVHHRPLPPASAAEVVARARKRLRLKRDVPPDRLRCEKFRLFLQHAWDDALEDFDDLHSRPPQMTNTEALELIREFKRRHYADWPDHPLPALNGKTPRQAVKTKKGRAAVDAIIKDMENHEVRDPKGAPFDFSSLRRELGLD